jgi:hypothetical protein
MFIDHNPNSKCSLYNFTLLVHAIKDLLFSSHLPQNIASLAEGKLNLVSEVYLLFVDFFLNFAGHFSVHFHREFFCVIIKGLIFFFNN